MNNAARNPAKPKKALKDGKVYGDILSAEEKKQLVAQKKKHKKGKKVPKSAQQTIPYVDYHRALDNGSGGMSEELSQDGCHPVLSGYLRMESLVVEGINRALGVQKTWYTTVLPAK